MNNYKDIKYFVRRNKGQGGDLIQVEARTLREAKRIAISMFTVPTSIYKVTRLIDSKTFQDIEYKKECIS